MPRKLVLCASSSLLTAGLWTGRALSSVRSFEDDEEGQRAVESLLRAAHGTPVYLMADTVDEDYRFETLPHAIGKDRRDMVERKLKQLYRNTPFYGADLQEREESKRRDDRYLFAALTNPDVFNPWLRLLTSSNLPIAGVFPLPMVSVGLVRTLELEQRNLLLVSKHEAGVRQTFVKDGRFRISRLTPIRSAGNIIESCAEEVRNTRMYLDALNVTHVDDMLNIVVLDQDNSLASLGSAIVKGRRNLQALHLSADDIVSKIGVDRTSLGASADALHLYLLGQRKTLDFNLAPPALTSGFMRYQVGKSIVAASFCVGTLAAAWCAGNLYHAMNLSSEAQRIATATRHEQARYQEITRSFPPTPVPTDRLQLSVDVAERIAGMARLPDATFRAVSQTLEKYPGVRLTGMQWKHGRLAQPDSTGTPTSSPQLSQSAILQMELTAQSGDIKGALAGINNVVRELGRNDQVAEAKITKMPLDLASSGHLSGSTAVARQQMPQTSQFDVELVLKPGV